MPDANDDPYAAIAEWYDIEHDPVTEDVECYQELIASVAGVRASVLEVGSGSGRLAAALALAGHTVTGVEPSGAMRARAEKRLAALTERVARRVHLAAGTATNPGVVPAEQYDILLFGCNVFAHLLTPAERETALAVLGGFLGPEGALLLDLDVAGPQHMADTMGQLWLSGIWVVPDQQLTKMAHFSTASPGPEPGTLLITHLYDVWAPGQPLMRTLTQMSLALPDADAVEAHLVGAGFGVVQRYGSYGLARWDSDADRAIFVATR